MFWRLQCEVFFPVPSTSLKEADSVNSRIFIRPEKFIINSLQTKFVKGKVKKVRFLGSAYEAEVMFDNEEVITIKTG